ncbi:hypothetical protein TI39_contig4202g00029 [Zymoseptoria brevis]|uniref:F-box domain-containing protein n=1 Tax=Zymoseptoria brevis TaxID=1047168 RepID=A0A0F4GAC5_9PEZI|nr:hypothetical protein TI39_contig4202g00029 [Zymoseptoria brevis]
MSSSNTANNPSIPPTTGCPFIEKIPSELRVRIYQYVFGKGWKNAPFDMLKTCRLIFDEAHVVYNDTRDACRHRQHNLQDPRRSVPKVRCGKLHDPGLPPPWVRGKVLKAAGKEETVAMVLEEWHSMGPLGMGDLAYWPDMNEAVEREKKADEAQDLGGIAWDDG